MTRVALFGDPLGVPTLLAHVPAASVAAVVHAAPRTGDRTPLEPLAAAAGVPLLAHDPADPQALAAELRELGVDLEIVYSYSLRLPPAVLDAAPRGGVNVHASLLPRYRAANPVQWVLIAGERETGVTVHELATEVDAGAIVGQERVPIAIDDTWRELLARCDETAGRMLEALLPAILDGTAPATPQDEAAASTFPRRTREDGRIDWGARVLDVYNLIRALVAPLPGAFDDEGVLDAYLTLAEVAALKQARADPGWGLRPRPNASVHEPMVLELDDGEEAVLHEWDWEARTARLTGGDPMGAAEAFALSELGLASIRRG